MELHPSAHIKKMCADLDLSSCTQIAILIWLTEHNITILSLEELRAILDKATSMSASQLPTS